MSRMIRRFVQLPPVLAALALLSFAPAPAPAQIIICEETAEPYVFILLDTSETMNRSAPCTAAQLAAGECGFACATSNCSTPTAGDHPGSKIYQTRQALYEVLSGIDYVHFGFASLNQDALSVRAKHWLYEATSPGPNLLSGIPYPAVGAQEAFGLLWSCGSGTGDAAVGCSASAPADLPDAWELSRARRLPKGGIDFNQSVSVFVRSSGMTYRVTYQPFGGVLGGPIQTTVSTVRCANGPCSSFIPVGTQLVSWNPVGDFLSFDNAASTPSRTAPETWFPQSAAADAAAVYPQCTSFSSVGWDPNNDSTADPAASGYNLRWPTDSSDPRGAAYSFGDVIPLDWLDNHKDDILIRLAPNLVIDPWATPDFRTATYFEDARQPGESFLRLRDENVRPLVAIGPTSIYKAMTSFRRWYAECGSGCSSPFWVDTAIDQDPLWECREKYLLVISDGGDTCPGSNPAADAASLYAYWDLRTHVFAVGVAPNTEPVLRSMAQNGGGEIFYPQTRQQLVDDLNAFFLSLLP